MFVQFLECNERLSTKYTASELFLTSAFEFPHAAVILLEKAQLITCMGSLISENVILGAGYCIRKRRYYYGITKWFTNNVNFGLWHVSRTVKILHAF